MTKKLIVGALNSPSLVGELQQYHRQQVQLNAKRGLIVLLAFIFLLLQYIGIFYPIKSASSSYLQSDTLYGGLSSKQDALLAYDDKISDLHKSAQALSISRNDLTTVNETSTSNWIPDGAPLIIAWSKSPIYKLPGETIETKPTTNYVSVDRHTGYTYFGHILKAANLKAANLAIVAGTSSSNGTFAILKDSGNFLTTNADPDTCFKQPDDIQSYGLCPNSNSFTATISAQNISYKTDAAFIKNHPGDRIQYTLQAKNNGQTSIYITPNLYIGDILEYAELSSVDDAIYKENSSTLLWPTSLLQPSQQKQFTFSVKLSPRLALNPTATTNGASYDCYMSTFFGTPNSIKTSCPIPKIVERMASTPPHTSILLIAWLIFATSVALYIKSYIFTKEREIILQHMRKKHD